MHTGESVEIVLKKIVLTVQSKQNSINDVDPSKFAPSLGFILLACLAYSST